MRLSEAGLDLIKRSEGFRRMPYRDAAGVLTVGYGHRILDPGSFQHGIDEEFAEHILRCDADDAAEAVESLVKVPLTQGQFDALTDFVFNLGPERLRESTLLRELNAGDYDAARRELLKWVHVGRKVVGGLKLRREAEYKLWGSTPDDDPANAAAVAV